MRMRNAECGVRIRPLLVVFAACLTALCAGAVNVNGNGASLHLATPDLLSGTAQTNGAGGRLVSAGTPVNGVVSANGSFAKVIIEPLDVMAVSGAPTVDFVANTVEGNAPLEVQFTSQATGGLYAIVSWTWNFGDDSLESNEEHPTHTYNDPGTYTVTLTLTTTGGPVMATKVAYITVTQGMPATGAVALAMLSAALAAVGARRLRYTP